VNNKKDRILGIPNRYYILLFIVLGFIAARLYPPILPHIQVPPEKYSETPLFGNFYWTNTLTAMVIADIIVILLALIVRGAVKKVERDGTLIPKGVTGVIEALLEIINNLTESTAGKWSKSIFPLFAAITLFLLVVNWTELIPGVDSIGILHQAEPLRGYNVQELGPNVATLVNPDCSITAKGEQETETGDINQEGLLEGRCYELVPYVRVLSTDLNFTVALALIAVVSVQIFGVRASGGRYFEKFFNVRGFSKNPLFGAIDFGVGLLELVSEFSKLLSFSFRLFGNIFAGSVLLFVIGTLVPVVAQSVFLLLEFFVGLIQAVVFGMLTMVFITQATSGHGEHASESH
jgi:F-type H+-transporting ATPase subunit a